jgi:hypothetical protein
MLVSGAALLGLGLADADAFLKRVLTGRALGLEPDLVPRIISIVATSVIKRLYYSIESYALGVLLAIVRADQSTFFSFKEYFFALRTSLHACISLSTI